MCRPLSPCLQYRFDYCNRSGIDEPTPDEIDVLLEEITEVKREEQQSKMQAAEIRTVKAATAQQTAKDVRRAAMQGMGESMKPDHDDQ